LTPEAARLLGPLRLGLSREELAVLYPDQVSKDGKFSTIYFVNPRYYPSTDLRLESGVSVTVVFDYDWTVAVIVIEDRRVRFRGGIGVGTAWREVKSLTNEYTYRNLGESGCYLAVCDGWWLRLYGRPSGQPNPGFALPIADEDTAYAMELRDPSLTLPASSPNP
jgi:hypothetical protein